MFVELTKAQREWLSSLADGSIKSRTGKTGFTCMQRGWTEWARDAEGKIVGEKITRKGLGALNG